jgi:hypothetical protein
MMNIFIQDKWKNLLLKTVMTIYFLMSTITLIQYFIEEYCPFLASGSSLSIYLASGLRMVFRLGYPVAAIGLFLLKRWGAWLLITVWLLQLIPSTVYFLLMSGTTSPGGLLSLVTLLISIGIIYACRSVLRGKVAKPLLVFFAAAVTVHSIYFLIWPR